MAKPYHPTAAGSGIVFLVDVDNTLLDNDRLILDLMQHIEQFYGAAQQARYSAILEEVRRRVGFVDYLGALQQYRLENLDEPGLLGMSSFLVDYPFAERVYPGALAVLAHLSRWGTPVILSDGDVVFQPRKVQRSGLWEAVQGRVLIYVHKEQMLDAVERHYPAQHYVMIDDKMRILDALRRSWGTRVTTVFPRQGHYALDAKSVAAFAPADLTVEHIGELLRHDFGELLARVRG
ncbi:MAG TPA: HAD family hydrolase [Steroidobacteraceae bacterium]|nr:HAD family hydrolase [Steroidobacteraceae bacterium]